ncbi:PbsX family transcriptional regulator [Mycobacterium kyorinense]|uniref:PbsX family transcriptional regulator n=1 Tax=Mycobacterium kyorinense TaxID=487514 RepID=A0A1A2Z9R8_9MYCO|nr:PE domain-containing protein [Mycobacterium kyorinense]OBI46393.1 PbsX family transcriptional regulator [Mycobacterium kyorinense]
MQPLAVDPAIAAIGTQVVANGTRGVAAGTTASAAVTSLMPAGIDEVSAQAAMAFASEGVQTLALNSFAQEELARAGAAYAEAAAIYAAVDEGAAGTLI